MKTRKITQIAALGISISLLMGAMTGCADDMQTSEQLVTPKEEMKEVNAPFPEQGDDGAKESISELVQAPERYQTAFGSNDVYNSGGAGEDGVYWVDSHEGNKISVVVDAPVVIPDAEGFRTYKVTSRVFTQEDYDVVNKVILNGASLYERDMELMAESNGFTKTEVKERIASLEKERKKRAETGRGKFANKTAYEAEGISYEEELRDWEYKYVNAPEEAVYVDVPAVISYKENTQNPEDNQVMGSADSNGRTYFVVVDNNLSDSWRWLVFKIGGGYWPANVDKAPEKAGFVIEDTRQLAASFMEQMGLDEYVQSGEEYYISQSIDENVSDEIIVKDGFGIHYTRSVDGIPVTYTHEEGTGVEGEWPSWPYESINFVFDEEGLCTFEWTNPYNIEKVSDEYLFLMPFSEIQNIFGKMMIEKYETHWENLDATVSYQVNEIRLGYMRIMEKGNPTEGTLIPVWDFFGAQTINEAESTTTGGPYESLLTINAMDGTIIDRSLGY